MGGRAASSSERTRDIAKIVLYHHERIDGLGYPEGLKGDQILFGSENYRGGGRLRRDDERSFLQEKDTDSRRVAGAGTV